MATILRSVKIGDCPSFDGVDALCRMGCIVHAIVDEEGTDTGFLKVVLPDGWRKQRAKGRGGGVDCLDAAGNTRLSVFCTGCSSTPILHIWRAFTIELKRQKKSRRFVAEVKRLGIVLFRTRRIHKSKLPFRDLDCECRALDEAQQWLNKGFPDWRDPVKGWS